MKSGRHKRRLRWAWLVLGCVALVGVFAPLLATDRPWYVEVDGAARYPAFAACWDADAGAVPDGAGSWREWVAAPPAGVHSLTVHWAPVPYDPEGVDEAAFYAGPSAKHWLGADRVGRDLAARLIHGAATALWVGLQVVLLAGLVGIALGALAGLRGGGVDFVILRVIELFQCFPGLVLVMCVVAFVAQSQLAIVLVLASVYWTSFARIVRGEFLSLRESEFVRTARGLGVGTGGLVLRHMLPAVRGPLGVVAAFVATGAIVVEATLSFLGLGMDTVSWGGALAAFEQGRASAWHLWVFPSFAIGVTVIALHSVADRSVAGRSVAGRSAAGRSATGSGAAGQGAASTSGSVVREDLA